MQALLHLAAAYESDEDLLSTTEEISSKEGIPNKYLESILRSLRQGGIIESHRGASGGYKLARPPKEISVADVMRVLDGPLAAVRGERPEDIKYKGSARSLPDVWIATRVALREVLEEVSLAHIISGNFPAKINKLSSQPGAWERRTTR